MQQMSNNNIIRRLGRDLIYSEVEHCLADRWPISSLSYDINLTVVLSESPLPNGHQVGWAYGRRDGGMSDL